MAVGERYPVAFEAAVQQKIDVAEASTHLKTAPSQRNLCWPPETQKRQATSSDGFTATCCVVWISGPNLCYSSQFPTDLRRFPGTTGVILLAQVLMTS